MVIRRKFLVCRRGVTFKVRMSSMTQVVSSHFKRRRKNSIYVEIHEGPTMIGYPFMLNIAIFLLIIIPPLVPEFFAAICFR